MIPTVVGSCIIQFVSRWVRQTGRCKHNKHQQQCVKVMNLCNRCMACNVSKCCTVQQHDCHQTDRKQRYSCDLQPESSMVFLNMLSSSHHLLRYATMWSARSKAADSFGNTFPSMPPSQPLTVAASSKALLYSVMSGPFQLTLMRNLARLP